jgi:hypothetical protein
VARGRYTTAFTIWTRRLVVARSTFKLDFVSFQGEKGSLYCDACKSFLYRSRVRAYVEKLFPIHVRKSVKTCRENFALKEFFWECLVAPGISPDSFLIDPGMAES